MKHQLGLHTKEEQAEALRMVKESHQRGVDAAAGGLALGVAFEAGFIHAIWRLAKLEGAKDLERAAFEKRGDLDRRVSELA